MRRVRAVAPAKVNLTLEVLGRRPDGYHELRSVMLTIEPEDEVAVQPAEALSLVLAVDTRPLDAQPADENLAYAAAVAMQEEAGAWQSASLRLEKRLPVAAGLGGGSSDAAATLRALERLWDLRWPVERLEPVAAELGSDVTFFLHGGAALVSGRGERVARLPDPPRLRLLLLSPPRPTAVPAKTASRYARLTPSHWSDGNAGERLAERLDRGLAVRDEDVVNVFESVLAEAQTATRAAMDSFRALGRAPHLAGSGPSFFLLLSPDEDPALPFAAGRAIGWTPRVVQSLSREATLALDVEP